MLSARRLAEHHGLSSGTTLVSPPPRAFVNLTDVSAH